MNKVTNFKWVPMLIFSLMLIDTDQAFAQVATPMASPYASVSEQVGLTDIKVKYNRPGVNDREIWGKVVPNGFSQPFPGFGSGNPFPWRAGANENTTIYFEHDVLVEGKPLPAGTYGLHMIPSDDDWTIIFSENTGSWGSFFYEESEDALRVDVTPEEASFTERLAYEFTDQQGFDQVTVALRWEEKRIPMQVQVENGAEVVLASMRDQLRSRGGFAWQGWATAANFCLQNNVNLEEGIAWASTAVGMNKAFNTMNLHAALLTKNSDVSGADEVMDEALELANQNQLNQYGYQLLNQERYDRALTVFELNVKRHPKAWNPHDSLAEALAKKGDNKNAKKHYQMALKHLPEDDDSNRERINKIIKELS